jgi:hypothetical protein
MTPNAILQTGLGILTLGSKWYHVYWLQGAGSAKGHFPHRSSVTGNPDRTRCYRKSIPLRFIHFDVKSAMLPRAPRKTNRSKPGRASAIKEVRTATAFVSLVL